MSSSPIVPMHRAGAATEAATGLRATVAATRRRASMLSLGERRGLFVWWLVCIGVRQGGRRQGAKQPGSQQM